ncbi:MAG: inorganic pyrophosphatase [Acutalibacteraceae bacterium]|nr:inorganic pyrophosphatase [Acutalibacteraceae bacterium]
MDIIGKTVEVTVDRPLGTYHPNHNDIFYTVNYGYVDGVLAPDGEWQDAYILGVEYPIQKFTGIVIAVVNREDDIESKWVVAPKKMSFSKNEIIEKIKFQEKYFKSDVVME